MPSYHLHRYLPISESIEVICVQCGKTKKRDPKLNYYLKKTKLNKESKQPIAEIKRRIQALLREIAIRRDKGCFLRNSHEAGKCGGYRNDGALILQFDHLNSRARALTFAREDLGVCACKRHHFYWKKQNPALYEELARKYIGPEKTKELDELIKDRASHPKTEREWLKEEQRLLDILEIMIKNEN